MAIILNGDTGISSIGALSGVTSISATNAALTGITSVASNAADTPVILQDSSSNSATCRAWVNFDGTGTVAIRADFNVSSITDDGTGQYTINFTNALPDTSYAASGICQGSSNGYVQEPQTQSKSTSAIKINTITNANVAFDAANVYLITFR
jgi:hypothetical protein